MGVVTYKQYKLLLTVLYNTQHTHTHSRGTRLRNAEKNVGAPLYAFNALQVVTLPKNYRPPEGTYKKLQT